MQRTSPPSDRREADRPVYYLDANVSHRVVTLLEATMDEVRTARDEGLQEASDDAHLLHAAQRGWVLVTHNWKDFRLLHHAWHRWPRGWWQGQQGLVPALERLVQRAARTYPQHGGVLVLDQLSSAAVAAAIIGWERDHDDGEAGALWRWHGGVWARHELALVLPDPRDDVPRPQTLSTSSTVQQEHAELGPDPTSSALPQQCAAIEGDGSHCPEPARLPNPRGEGALCAAHALDAVGQLTPEETAPYVLWLIRDEGEVEARIANAMTEALATGMLETLLVEDPRLFARALGRGIDRSMGALQSEVEKLDPEQRRFVLARSEGIPKVFQRMRQRMLDAEHSDS